jgi:hypothetical protein
LTDRQRSAFELQRLDQRASARRLRIDGLQWLVYEIDDRDLEHANGKSLVFESETTVRRVRDYPSDWRSLSDERLAAVSWRR